LRAFLVVEAGRLPPPLKARLRFEVEFVLNLLQESGHRGDRPPALPPFHRAAVRIVLRSPLG
jgi:hypothetical protein